MIKKYDVIIIGGGAAGIFAASSALSNGRTVAILDMGEKPARKVLVSGGGRCNFTNLAVSADRYFGKNPDFVRSVLSKLKPTDILDWAKRHNLKYVEKTAGQFFCATNSSDFVSTMLQDINGVDIFTNTTVTDIEKSGEYFEVQSKNNVYQSKSVIIATGGVSYPALNTSDFGYIIAKKFGHKIIPVQPGLTGLKTKLFSSELSGISVDSEIKIGKKKIQDSLLFTHFGIGGPLAYRTSLFDLNKDIYINFLPRIDVYDWLIKIKKIEGKKSLQNLLSMHLPLNFAKWICNPDGTKNIADFKDTEIKVIAERINNFLIPPEELKRLGFEKAEVTVGGVSTEFISSKTMESKLCPGLYFAGEVLDIAGDLGGFNLHFAFASGFTAGNYA
ncbi:MAG TPA: aminoacetone oxidase family FAD-binding enzyme [Alphaproteobacteria bacterium]|nr:aminoacetone oxidase family FAD-binding enzyme [Alphaproteobacteria bacterium]